MRSIEHVFETGRSSGVARTPAPARLTRRGRAVVVVATLLLLLVAGFTVGRVSSQAAGPAKPLPTVTVHPGETLWQIAARVAPSDDRRVVVREIEQLNRLSDGRVVAGQQLRLPR